MTLTAFLRRVVQILDEVGVPYMLTGSLAAAYYATPRATQYIDIIIEAQESGIERIVQGLLDEGCYVDRNAALEAWRTHGQFNAIGPDSGWKVDLIVRKERSFSKTEFERREDHPKAAGGHVMGVAKRANGARSDGFTGTSYRPRRSRGIPP